MKKSMKIFFGLALIALMAGCAPPMQPMQPPLESMGAGNTSSTTGKYIPKVDSFQVILDTSLSMDEAGQRNYFPSARSVVSRLNQAIPSDQKYRGGLRTFGHNKHQSSTPTTLAYGMTDYTRAGFHEGLGKIKYTGGPSPLAGALDAAGGDLRGKSAVVIVSDGLFMDDAPAAAKRLKDKLGSDVCIYTISVGSRNNGAGQDMMKELAQIGQCGSAVTDASLSDMGNMQALVDKIFLAPKPPPKRVAKKAPPKDSDGDGVPDYRDKCPNTPRGEFVDENGCTLKLTLHINFDFDSAIIKPEFTPDLNRAAKFIQKNSDVPFILIAGHTDHTGTMEYNQELSEKRAKAVRQHLIENYGIKADRLGAKGYGKTQPVADNKTKEGRYQNRRVEVVCCVLKPN